MFENTIKDIAYSQEIADLEKDNEELKAQIEQLKKQYKKQRNRRIDELQKAITEKNSVIEKMKCCGNCGNKRCTSKYRGNSCYHRQEDGYACADNEDWIPRKDK